MMAQSKNSGNTGTKSKAKKTTKVPSPECSITTKYVSKQNQWVSSCACDGFAMGVPSSAPKEGEGPPSTIEANANLHLSRHRK